MSSQQTIDNFLPNEEARFNNWIFEVVKSYIKGRTLELGSGSGDFSSIFIEHGLPIHLSDPDKSNRNYLRAKFEPSPYLKGVHDVDLLRHDFIEYHAPMIGVFSTVLCINIDFSRDNDLLKEAFVNAKSLLHRNGCLIISIPSYTEAYPGTEQNLRELKRGNRKPLGDLLGDLRVLKNRYFNFEMNEVSNNKFHKNLNLIAVTQKGSR